MIVDIRCPKCHKLVAKKEEGANSRKIYFFCTRCKNNFEIKEEKCSSSQ